MTAPDPAAVQILQGTCHAIYQYDVGQGIHLEACKRLIEALPAGIRHQRATPADFQFDPLPLLVVKETPPLQVAGRATTGEVKVLLYDFGAISFTYSIPLSGTLGELCELSCRLFDDPALWEASRTTLQGLVADLGPAIDRCAVADMVEDYFIFQVEAVQPADRLIGLPESSTLEIARILRSEQTPLSPQEIQESLSHRVSFGQDDLTLIDWNAALILGAGAADVRAVLEFANVQLLECRFLDRQLDDHLDEAYKALTGQPARGLPILGRGGPDLFRVARMQVDSAVLFEQVHNALKLIGDPFLVRVYRSASKRLRLGEWDSAIQRKIETVESIYEKLSDRAANRRLELLEWIIIILIAVSIALPFLPGLGGK